MQILAEYSKPYIIDSLTSPVVIKYNWMFNAQAIDFVLNPITYLEETSGAAVKIRINNTEFWVPATWYILVTDKETYQIDTVSITSCASTPHIAFAFAPEEQNVRTLDIMVLDYADNMSLVHPMIAKAQALVHPVGPALWTRQGEEMHLSVVIGPHDLYKHLTNKVVGDIFSW
jgi:hypothetical protein